MSYNDPELPSDPWQQADPHGRSGGYEVYAGYDAGEPEPEPEEERQSPALLAVLVVILVIVLCGGGVAGLYLLGAKPGGTANASGSSPSAHRGSASPTANYDPTAITTNNCVVNDGTGDNPRLRQVPCAPGTYIVLARIDHTIDKTQCSAVAGASYAYFYDTTPDSADFVLCLKWQ